MTLLLDLERTRLTNPGESEASTKSGTHPQGHLLARYMRSHWWWDKVRHDVRYGLNCRGEFLC